MLLEPQCSVSYGHDTTSGSDGLTTYKATRKNPLARALESAKKSLDDTTLTREV